MQLPNPTKPNLETQRILVDRDDIPYVQLLDEQNFNDNNSIGCEKIIRPHSTQVAPDQLLTYDSAIHKQTNNDKKAFVLKITFIWIGQIQFQILLCALAILNEGFTQVFYQPELEMRKPLVYFLLSGYVVLVLASQIVVMKREPTNSNVLMIITTLFTGLLQAGLISPAYYGDYDNLVWFGVTWIAITILGFFSLISIAIYLRNEKDEINPSIAQKYMYIIPICIATLSLVGSLNQNILLLFILVFGLGGSIYEYYFLTLIGRTINTGIHNFGRTEFIQAALLLNRNMIIPCLG